jgi:hypothetical protein
VITYVLVATAEFNDPSEEIAAELDAAALEAGVEDDVSLETEDVVESLEAGVEEV